MQARLVRYFLAIAREKHFARAARACNVTQPTLSAGLAALEARLGKRLVERDRRFIGLTVHGEAVLPWARQFVTASENMAQAAQNAEGPLRGTLRLGAIPACMPMVGYFTRALLNDHPQLRVSVQSMTSRAIERDLDMAEIDAGITYLDHEPPAHMLSVPLYIEHYMFFARRRPALDARTAMSWSEAAGYPLALLDTGMQNRRILDARVAERGQALAPCVTTDSYVALLAMVQGGDFATIFPNSYAALLSGIEWATALPFDEDGPGSRIGLIVPERAPTTTMAAAAIAVADSLVLPGRFTAP